jgi:adenylosuccinate lyase
MIPRYDNAEISAIHTNVAKLLRWQDTELAVIEARVKLGEIAAEVHTEIKKILEANPPDVEWWLAKEKEVGHDFNAFIDERRRFLPVHLQAEFHKDMTSYDGEEPAFAEGLNQSSNIIERTAAIDLFETIDDLARQHRFTAMLEHTHGQWAKLRTFGGRVLTWRTDLLIAFEQFQSAQSLCGQSRISGAIGNYGGGLTPEIEKTALDLLGLDPLLGSTQIAPRVLYAPLAQALLLICETLGKIANDIRLGARSGFTLWHEPFTKKQKGSSAMPHKKNPIITEQMFGMLMMARGRVLALTSIIQTWEARDIGQSCVERVDWVDLFHITMRMLTQMTKVLKGLVVYKDNMLREIIEARGTYASDEAKNFLAAEFAVRGIEAETAYRILQLASFCVFQPDEFWTHVRNSQSESLDDVDALLSSASRNPPSQIVSIQDFIPSARLFPVAELEADQETVTRWNEILADLFSNPEIRAEWNVLFKPSHLLQRRTVSLRAVAPGLIAATKYQKAAPSLVRPSVLFSKISSC